MQDNGYRWVGERWGVIREGYRRGTWVVNILFLSSSGFVNIRYIFL